MFRIILLSSCIAMVISAKINPRIYKGYNATDGMFPYMASILDMKHRHICGGSIISKKYILSAAHCFETGGPQNYSVCVGSIYWNNSGFKYDVETIINHPKYYTKRDSKNKLIETYNDISLIAVKPVITFSRTVNYIPINIYKEKNLVGVQARFSGWGETENKPISLNLKYDDYTIKDIGKCATLINANIDNSQYLCTLPINWRGHCEGDSGGPLVYNNSLIGIASSSSECDSSNKIGFHTNVAYYATWIQEIMKNY